MALKQYLVIKEAGVFDATGSLRPMGSLATLDEDKVGDNPRHVVEVDPSLQQSAVVQVSAIAPTGPNPKDPQQIPSDAVQTIRGYEQAGAVLVGEVTVDEATRLEAAQLLDDGDDTQGKVVEALSDAQNAALDHDKDGKAGGSLKGEDSTRAKGAAKAKV